MARAYIRTLMRPADRPIAATFETAVIPCNRIAFNCGDEASRSVAGDLNRAPRLETMLPCQHDYSAGWSRAPPPHRRADLRTNAGDPGENAARKRDEPMTTLTNDHVVHMQSRQHVPHLSAVDTQEVPAADTMNGDFVDGPRVEQTGADLAEAATADDNIAAVTDFTVPAPVDEPPLDEQEDLWRRFLGDDELKLVDKVYFACMMVGHAGIDTVKPVAVCEWLNTVTQPDKKFTGEQVRQHSSKFGKWARALSEGVPAVGVDEFQQQKLHQIADTAREFGIALPTWLEDALRRAETAERKSIAEHYESSTMPVSTPPTADTTVIDAVSNGDTHDEEADSSNPSETLSSALNPPSDVPAEDEIAEPDSPDLQIAKRRAELELQDALDELEQQARIRQLERQAREREAQARIAEQDELRAATSKISKRDIKLKVWHARADASRKRATSIAARRALVERQGTWLKYILWAMVGLGIVYTATTVQHNMAPDAAWGEIERWKAYLLDSFATVPLLCVTVLYTTSLSVGTQIDRKKFGAVEVVTLIASLGLNCGPALAHWAWGDVLGHAVVPIMMVSITWLSASISTQFATFAAKLAEDERLENMKTPASGVPAPMRDVNTSLMDS